MFSPYLLLPLLLNVFFFIIVRVLEKMGPSPILSIINAVPIGIMPNFKGGNNGYGLKCYV